MNTAIKTGLAALLFLAISCKKENIRSSANDNDISEMVSGKSVVLIGTQTWMAKNLSVSRYSNGDKIPQVKDSVTWAKLTTGAWCWYNNDSVTGAVYGKLYNWYAVKDPRGLAPTGWHVASDSEWYVLSNFLGPGAGGKLKETGTSHWFDPNVDALNSSGFTGLPGGYRSEIGQFCYIRYLGLFWTSTGYSSSVAWYRRLLCYSNFLDYWRFPKQMGFSVRCIKD
jgi:uncharacterized protein (TIGR02145 family)